MNYLEKEEKKYLSKIMQTRSKAAKIQDLKAERDRIMQSIMEGKQVNEAQRQERQFKAKTEYENRQARKLQSAYQQYVKLR